MVTSECGTIQERDITYINNLLDQLAIRDPLECDRYRLGGITASWVKLKFFKFLYY